MKLRVLFLLAFVAVVLSGYHPTVKAHEGRGVGDYTIVLGWRVEPAYTGLFNGPEITVTRSLEAEHDEHGQAEEGAEHGHDAAEAEESGAEHSNEGHHHAPSEPVTGLEDSLQIEVSFGPASRVLNLRPVRGEDGHYVADLIPMLPGDYSFRVFGTIDGVEVDELFSAADGQFSSVQPIEDIQFP